MSERRFVAFYHFIDWTHWSLGLHIDFRGPNVEIHLPFGFIRFGLSTPPMTLGQIVRCTTFGLDSR